MRTQSILKEIIESLGANKTLVITSSGNEKIDNDVEGNEHFPSGFEMENVMGVGGFTNFLGPLVSQGNWGTTSIDIAAFYGPYDFTYQINGTQVYDAPNGGTSYGTALTSATMAKFIFENNYHINVPSNLNLKEEFLDSNKVGTDTIFNGRIKDSKFIPR